MYLQFKTFIFGYLVGTIGTLLEKLLTLETKSSSNVCINDIRIGSGIILYKLFCKEVLH